MVGRFHLRSSWLFLISLILTLSLPAWGDGLWPELPSGGWIDKIAWLSQPNEKARAALHGIQAEAASYPGQSVLFSSVPSSLMVNERFTVCFQFTQVSAGSFGSSKLQQVRISQSDGSSLDGIVQDLPYGGFQICPTTQFWYASPGLQWIKIQGYWQWGCGLYLYSGVCQLGWDTGDLRQILVQQASPAPSISSFSPSSVQAGSSGFTLTVNGSGFVETSFIQWNGSPRTTFYISATELRATILAGDVSTPGTATVYVTTPPPGGGSASKTIPIVSPLPFITSLIPSTVLAGSGGFNLQVFGGGFINTSVIQWNGAARSTTFVHNGKLIAAIPAADVLSPGTANVSVFNPSPGGGTSNLFPLSITPPENTILRLNNSRFEVSVRWVNYNDGSQGQGRGVQVTGDSGYFWFFSSANIELMIKVLDGTGSNGYYWVMFGALSDVQYSILIRDTLTGVTKTYDNPAHNLASGVDIRAFQNNPLELTSAGSAIEARTLAQELRSNSFDFGESPWYKSRSSVSTAEALTTGCSTTGSILCLNSNRFSITVQWRNYNDNSTGYGQAVALTGDSGYFWFFSSNNIELVLKILDGTASNGHFWMMYGALTDVEYTITLTDTQTGQIKTYFNPAHRLNSGVDILAMP